MISAFEIASALAAEFGGGIGKTGGQYLTRCPCHADRTASLAIRDAQVGPLVFCHAGCNTRDVIDELTRRGLWSRDPRSAPPARRAPLAQKNADDADRSAYAAAIWNAAVDPRGTLGETYLLTRSWPLHLPDTLCGRVLRFHARCPFGKDAAGNRINVPALIAAFRPMRGDDEDGPPQAIHRIGLNRDGSKIAKMMLGPVDGCAVKLDPDEAVEEELGIAEGFETALALYLDGWHPMWALGSAARIKTLEPIPGIEALTIFADHDDTGLRDARACAQRWVDAGFDAIIKYPTKRGRDFADA